MAAAGPRRPQEPRRPGHDATTTGPGGPHAETVTPARRLRCGAMVISGRTNCRLTGRRAEPSRRFHRARDTLRLTHVSRACVQVPPRIRAAGPESGPKMKGEL